MAGNFLDIRQSIYRPTPVMIGTGVAAASVDTLLGSIDSELQKLFEDRNLLMVDGGIFSLSADATTLIFTQNINLTLNSTSTGGPSISSIVSVAASPITFTGVGDLWYVLINRTTTTSVTSVVVAAATGLPATTYANQDVFLMGIRILSGDGHTAGIYLRGGTIVFAGQSARIGSPSTQDDSFSIANTTDHTKQINFSTGGATTGTSLTLASAVTANRVITFPDITDTVVTLNAVQTLTNKTLTSPVITGATISNSAITNSTITYSVHTDSTSTGSNITLPSADIQSGIVRLTNTTVSPATSIIGIPAGTAGQILILENLTGNAITIETSGSAPTAIHSGVGTLTLNTNCSVTFVYDAVQQFWFAIGYISTFNTTVTVNGLLTLTAGGNSSTFTVNSANVTGISTSGLQLGGTSQAKIATLGPTTMVIQNPGSGSYATILEGPVNQSGSQCVISGSFNINYNGSGVISSVSNVTGTGYTATVIHPGGLSNGVVEVTFDVPFGSTPSLTCSAQMLDEYPLASPQNGNLNYANGPTLGGDFGTSHGANGFIIWLGGGPDANSYPVGFVAMGPAAF